MTPPVSRPTKSLSRSPSRRETPNKKDQIGSIDSIIPTKDEAPELPRPPSSSRLLVKKISLSEPKTIDIAARSGSKTRKSVVSSSSKSRLSTPRANQMAPSVKDDVKTDRRRQGDTDTSRRSASTPKNISGRSSRSGTPSNKTTTSRTSTPTSKTSTPKAPKREPTSIKITTDSTSSKSSKGPSVRKTTTKVPPGSLLSKKDSKDESKSTTSSTSKAKVAGLSRAQKAEEKHRKRVTLAQGAGKTKSSTMKTNGTSGSGSISDPHLHRRSSVSRAQRLAYIAKTRKARSSTQAFSNVEGDEVCIPFN